MSRQRTIPAIVLLCWILPIFCSAAPTVGPFEHTGQVVLMPSYEQSPFAIECEGRIHLLVDNHTNRTEKLHLGDHVHVRGQNIQPVSGAQRDYSHPEYRAIVLDIDFISAGCLPPAERMSIAAFNTENLHNRRISLQGTVSGIFRDDIDENFAFLTLSSGNNLAYIAFALSPGAYPVLHAYLDAEVIVTGIASGFLDYPGRIHTRQVLYTSNPDDFSILRRPRKDRFDADSYTDLITRTPREITESPAVRVKARVLGTWHGDRMVVMTASNDVITVETAEQRIPHPSESVEIVGHPETDLFTIDLTRATWRPCETIDCGLLPPRRTTLKDLYWSRRRGKLMISPDLHGKLISVKGIVKSFLKDERGNRRILIADGPDSMVVDFSSFVLKDDGITEGCHIEATGICVRESEYWRPHNPFPRHKGLFLVPRAPEDIVVLSRPSWWTPARLLMIIGSLLALLIAIMIWNLILRHLVIRKGRELAKGEINRMESELKVFERTRLAVELHDSVAQNLTGVSMEIRAAQRARMESAPGLERHLTLAAKTLDSCREELRNCLWDLRNLTIDEESIDEVLRQALRPHLGEARLNVRFNVPRERFTDNTLHAIVRIIRELATNAVRHGDADEIKIAGCIENGKLLFSVADNGCGFDPDLAPGMEQGHFGLQGIRDRVDILEGEFTIISKPGSGTKAKISIDLARDKT